jgi:uncharacterized repeat protein (TIGR02543 family)
LHPSGITSDATSPTGLSPGTIEGAYGFTSAPGAGSGRTIAIVDAYNDPSASADLNAFSAEYGLPLECTGPSSPSPCFEFTQVNQTGGSALPTDDPGWDLEISLDIEWAHALAPAASILLVEADDESDSNLLAAEEYAADNAAYVSNSWGSSEFSAESALDPDFAQPGVSYFAAAGDLGGEVDWPSSSPGVISVGGTSLKFTSGGSLAQESAWSDGGGGCSLYESASSYQSTGSVNCGGMRATPDLSLDADPNSGVSVYDTNLYDGQSGWWTVGGTSASTPMVAAEAAVNGVQVNASYLYASPANIPLRDVISGSNGYPAQPGYDLATGLGAWSYTPGPPTGLTATRAPGGIALSWSAPSGATVGGYTVWRGSASGAETTEVATLGPAATSFTDTSVDADSTYFYEVRAVDGAGTGPLSNEASASTGTFHTVSFDANGGAGTMAAETADEAEALTVDAFTRAGYSFAGWNTAADGSGNSYSDGAPYPFTADVTLYARWTPRPSYTVSFAANGGTGTMAAESANVPTTLTADAFTRAGYSFAGWNTAADGFGTAYGDGALYPFGASATLYAQWAALVSPGTGPGPAPAAPTVAGIMPGAGPAAGGTPVTITGTGFSTTLGATTVAFGAVVAVASCSSPTVCVATSPPEAAGTVEVAVTAAGGTSTTSPADSFTFVSSPLLTGLTPSFGPRRGGVKVTIRGSGFAGAVSVHFGAKAAGAVHLISPSELTATAPAGSGVVYVTVSAGAGQSGKTSAARFTYVGPPTVTAVTPPDGSRMSGPDATIRGSNFVGTVSVYFGTQKADWIRVLSSSEIIAAVPPSTGAVYVIVRAAGGSSKKAPMSRVSFLVPSALPRLRA